jgi:TetR/AcrR family transcriptional regulator of autoinduction and epiphytic fitness
MPRRRVEFDRAEKVDEILDAAQSQLRDSGYDSLSIAALARRLGIAQNSIYWYYPSKDALVVASVERMLGEIVSRKPPASRGLERQVLWFVDQLGELNELRAALTQRASRSPVVAEFVDRTNTQLQQMLTHAFTPRVPAAERADAVASFLAAAQSSYLDGLPPARRRRVLAYILKKLTDRPTATS